MADSTSSTGAKTKKTQVPKAFARNILVDLTNPLGRSTREDAKPYDVIETTDVQTHIRISETKSRWVSRFRTFPVQETL